MKMFNVETELKYMEARVIETKVIGEIFFKVENNSSKPPSNRH